MYKKGVEGVVEEDQQGLGNWKHFNQREKLKNEEEQYRSVHSEPLMIRKKLI